MRRFIDWLNSTGDPEAVAVADVIARLDTQAMDLPLLGLWWSRWRTSTRPPDTTPTP